MGKKEMIDFVSFYRRFTNVSGKQSFSTLYTAINVLAGHYTSYGPKFPVPEEREARLLHAERLVVRGLVLQQKVVDLVLADEAVALVVVDVVGRVGGLGGLLELDVRRPAHGVVLEVDVVADHDEVALLRAR